MIQGLVSNAMKVEGKCNFFKVHPILVVRAIELFIDQVTP